MEECPVSDFKLKAMKFQYRLTALSTIPLGLAIIIFPGLVRKAFKMKEQDQAVFGITGSVYLAFGLLSTRGLKEPLKWSPILLLQFVYKVIWFTGVLGLMAKRGEFDLESVQWLMIGFVPFVVGDPVALPWKYLLGREH